MSTWVPRATVATVVEREGYFLMVEERDKTTGTMVFNQPAGHLEEGESLVDAAYRETLEETRWEVGHDLLFGFFLYQHFNVKTYLLTSLR